MDTVVSSGKVTFKGHFLHYGFLARNRHRVRKKRGKTEKLSRTEKRLCTSINYNIMSYD